ncbi:MAG: GxxExxY protein [Puniceicoccales bacterium]|jgi:hypothetical protein|nr:GxxExxY protein [Puniceicoccales bacterium]
MLDDITGAIVDASIRIHTDLGTGLLESVYEAVLARTLEKRGLRKTRRTESDLNCLEPPSAENRPCLPHIYGKPSIRMKTTLEIPDAVFRKAKTVASRNGQSLGSYITHAIDARLAEDARRANTRPWMRHAGALKSHAAELAKLRATIADEFEQIEEDS